MAIGIKGDPFPLSGFTLASMLCGMAWDIRSMIVFRAFQGLFGGVMLVGWLHRMTSRYIQALGDPTIGQTAALKKLWEAAYREARVQAFADACLVIAVCFAISAMMVPLMRGVTPK